MLSPDAGPKGAQGAEKKGGAAADTKRAAAEERRAAEKRAAAADEKRVAAADEKRAAAADEKRVAAADEKRAAAADEKRVAAAEEKRAAAADGKGAERRGPGRPPSKPLTPALLKRGVVDSPENPNNRLEFAYHDPSILKQLFAYFKNIKAREVHLRCTPRGLTFFARDHSKTSRNVAVIAGEHVNWHYCEGEFVLGINRENVEKMFAGIDRTFYKVTILQAHDDPTNITFIFKDGSCDKDCIYKIMVTPFSRDDDLYEAEAALTPEHPPPIEFTLTARQFKKTINDAAGYSETLTIEKLGAAPLQLTYAKASMTYNEVYRSAELIRLKSLVGPLETFRTTVKVANVRSLASSMVTDDVRILCRENSDILFRSAIDDKALVVSTLICLV